MTENTHEEEKLEWYYRGWVIAIAILCFGPLGLIPLWFRPKTKMYVKILVSVIVFALTFWVVSETAEMYKKLLEYYRELGDLV
ncbi:MAG: hypothetical protein ACE5JK_02605 [Candidatus Omnitrophota bacterium]